MIETFCTCLFAAAGIAATTTIVAAPCRYWPDVVALMVEIQRINRLDADARHAKTHEARCTQPKKNAPTTRLSSPIPVWSPTPDNQFCARRKPSIAA